MDLCINIAIVRKILQLDKAARDCDLRLYCLTIRNDLGKEIDGLRAKDLLDLILDGTLRHFESVSRVRRKLQELHPSLRGDRWEERHNIQGDTVNQLTFNF